MLDKKISQLDLTTTIGAADLMTTVQGGGNKRITGTNLINAIAGNKLDRALNDGDIFVGNVSNIAAGVPISGEASIINTGALTLDNASVIGKILTGFASGAGIITGSDTILSAAEKLDGNIATKEDAFSKNTAFNKNFETSPANIKMNGIVSVGALSTIARADHIHAIDTSRAADSAVVHLTGNESIGGEKDFTTGIKIASSALISSITTGASENDKLVTKGYADALISAAIILQGDWNASTNTPDITTTTTTGFAWRVSVAGSTDLGGITDWEVGDLAAKTATGWLKIDNEDISAVWGNITGTLSNQTDLQGALDGKEPTLTKGNLTEITSSILTITGGTGAIIGSGVTIEIDQADVSNDGYLGSVDWGIFNNKQDALTNGVDALASAEVTQLANINSITISNTQWSYVGNMNQGLATGDSVDFTSINTDTISEKTADNGVNIANDLILSARQINTPATISIVSNNLDVTDDKSVYRITSTESSPDQVDTISAGTDGQIIYIMNETSSQVQVRNEQAPGANNNIFLSGGSKTLNQNNGFLMLIYNSNIDTNGAWVGVI